MPSLASASTCDHQRAAVSSARSPIAPASMATTVAVSTRRMCLTSVGYRIPPGRFLGTDDADTHHAPGPRQRESPHRVVPRDVGGDEHCLAPAAIAEPEPAADGDECVLGLMAKHVAQGKEFPVFFYGQHYALSSVEAAAGALGFLRFGVSAVSLKLAMLALWTVGILFVFLAQSRFVGASRSFWITSVLLLNPVWAAWSMKAGGGYITAFTATAVLLWLLTRDRTRETIVRWLVAGALTAVDLSGAAALVARPAADPGRGSGLAASTVLGNRLSRCDGRRDSAGEARDRHEHRDMGRAHDRQSRPLRIAVARRVSRSTYS